MKGQYNLLLVLIIALGLSACDKESANVVTLNVYPDSIINDVSSILLV